MQAKLPEASLWNSHPLSAVCDLLHSLLIAADQDSLKILYANQTACTALGYSQDDLLRLTLLDLYPSQERDYVQHRLTAQTLTLDFLLPLSFQASDGTLLDVETWVHRGVVEQQNFLVMVSNDKSPKSKVRQELERIHELNRKIVQEAPIGIFTCDRAGRITMVNRAHLRINHVPDVHLPEDFLGMQVIVEGSTIDKNGLLPALQALWEGVPFQRDIEDFITRSGDTVSVRAYGVPLYDSAGSITEALVLVEDITEQIQSQTRYQSLISAIPDLLFEVRSDGLFLSYKPSENIDLFVPPERFLSKKVEDVFPPETASLIMDCIQQTIETKTLSTREYQLLMQNEPRDYEVRVMPSVEGEVLTIVRDITEHKKADRALERHERLLEGIAQATNQLLEPGNLDADLSSAIEIIGCAAQAGSVFISQDYTHPETGEAMQKIRTIWCDESFGVGSELKKLTDIPWRDNPLEDAHQTLIQGNIFQGGIESLPPYGQEIFRSRHLDLALLLVPIFIRHTYWGYIGIQVYQKGWVWTINEITTLQTMAANIGASVLRDQIERLLEGIAKATNRLLEPGNLDEAINEALEIVGRAANVETVYICENYPHSVTGELAFGVRFVWNVERFEGLIPPQVVQDIGWQSTDLMETFSLLSSGKIIQGNLNTVPADYRNLYLNLKLDISMVVVPIFAQQQFWGFIGLNVYRQDREWTVDEISAVQTMAASVSSAIQRNHFEQQLREEHEMATTLREVGVALNSTLDLDEVLGRILDQVQRVIPYKAANIMIIENGIAHIVRSEGYQQFGVPAERMRQFMIPVETWTILQEMITTHQPYACPNVSQHPHWISVPETTWIRSWLGTPIVVHGEVVGLFSLDSDQIGFYTQKHAERIVPFAEQAAIAFTNARLYQQLNTLHQTARDILSQLELEDMLEQLAQTILDTTHTTSVTICDYDPEYHCGKVLLTCCIPNAPCADTLLERGTGITFTTPLLQQLLASHKRSRVLFPPELQVALPGINPVIHMMIVTPMFSDERMIGFMLIGESRAGYLHTADEIRMSEAITDLAAIALEKAMLFENIQRLERVKSDMIRMASHDIRSPLTRAQAVLEMLDNQLGAQVTPKQQNYFRILREATGQIQDITTNILSLKRIDEHHEQEKLINWRSLIDEVVHAVALDFEMRQQKLNVEYDSALPMTHGDPLRLSLALTNLLTNANKYSHTKSTVTIRALTRDYGDKPYLTIEVEDNGPGIPPENQKRLFQQYYRANMDPSIPGTGLGLSLVRFVIEEHQGSVYVNSDPGQGSIFGFRLPIR